MDLLLNGTVTVTRFLVRQHQESIVPRTSQLELNLKLKFIVNDKYIIQGFIFINNKFYEVSATKNKNVFTIDEIHYVSSVDNGRIIDNKEPFLIQTRGTITIKEKIASLNLSNVIISDKLTNDRDYVELVGDLKICNNY